MTDNSTLPATGDIIAADEISGIKHQRVKVQHGADGAATDASTANPFPVLIQSVSGVGTLPVSLGDGPTADAFGRLRVSNPTTLFDSKQLHDSQALRWDDQEVSGAGTASAHQANEASTRISVSATTAGKRVRQTFQRFNYQPGKSQLLFLTGVLVQSGGGTGINCRIGQFDDENGIFFHYDEGTMKVGIRSYTSGAAVDTEVTQTSWNLDTLDGNGASAVTIDPTTAQIMVIDYEWLGVGRVRVGFVVDGAVIYCHEFNHANSVDKVYMTTPNNPIRYEIENDGTGAASSLDHICATVITEGGEDQIGELKYASTAGTHLDANTANTLYAVVGIRLKSTHLDAVVKQIGCSLISETNDDFEWVLMLNPAVAGTFTYGDLANSAIQYATGDSTNTVTDDDDKQVTGGFVKTSVSEANIVPNALWIGSAIDGTVDELVLCARPLTGNADIQGSLNWRELT